MSSLLRPTRRKGPQRLVRRYGPWAVVTGASSGLGLAAAEALAELGFGVVPVARRAQVLTDVATRLAREGATDVRVVAVDLATADGVRELVSATEDLDVGLLVHAAVSGTSGRFSGADLVRELDMLAVSCVATTSLSLAFGTRFLSRGAGGLCSSALSWARRAPRGRRPTRPPRPTSRRSVRPCPWSGAIGASTCWWHDQGL